MELDEIIIKKAIDGDHDAFRKIVDTYKSYVFKVCMSFVRDTHEAENLTQETFIKVYNSLSQFENKGLKTWIGKIAANKSLDWLRKTKLQREQRIIHIEDDAVLHESTKISIEENFIRKEQSRKVIKLCNALSEKYRVVMKKYYFQSKSYQEISDEEGISVKTVESRLYRAKKAIRQKWEEGD